MNRTVAIFFAIIGVGCAYSIAESSFAQFGVDEDEGPYARLISISKRDTTNDTCTSAFSCASCTVARVCRPTTDGWTVVQTTTCDAFCDYSTGTCSDVPNAVCGETDDFICMQENDKFPSSENQTSYHVCTNYTAKQFECVLTGYAYNPSTQVCEDGFSSNTFNCTEKGTKVPHPYDAQYFAYCGDNATVLVIDKCDDNFQLNVTSQECEPHCTEEGVFADPSDCTKYIECSSVWVSGVPFLVPEYMSCVNDTGYDPSQFMCVSLTDLTSCTDTS